MQLLQLSSSVENESRKTHFRVQVAVRADQRYVPAVLVLKWLVAVRNFVSMDKAIRCVVRVKMLLVEHVKSE